MLYTESKGKPTKSAQPVDNTKTLRDAALDPAAEVRKKAVPKEEVALNFKPWGSIQRRGMKVS